MKTVESLQQIVADNIPEKTGFVLLTIGEDQKVLLNSNMGAQVPPFLSSILSQMGAPEKPSIIG